MENSDGESDDDITRAPEQEPDHHEEVKVAAQQPQAAAKQKKNDFKSRYKTLRIDDVPETNDSDDDEDDGTLIGQTIYKESEDDSQAAISTTVAGK